MPPAWSQRREAWLRACIGSSAVCQQMMHRLGECVGSSPHALATQAGGGPGPRYLQGLRSHSGRQNAEKLAAWVAVARQRLPDCLGTACWDHRPLSQGLGGHVVDQLGAPEGILPLEPSSCPQRGTPSVGVQRPWGGPRGQGDNCPVRGYRG